MGGGGYDWQDVQEERERERRNHVCLSIEGMIDQCRDIARLTKILELATARIQKVNADTRAETERRAREQAFHDELTATAEVLRKKHGL